MPSANGNGVLNAPSDADGSPQSRHISATAPQKAAFSFMSLGKPTGGVEKPTFKRVSSTVASPQPPSGPMDPSATPNANFYSSSNPRMSTPSTLMKDFQDSAHFRSSSRSNSESPMPALEPDNRDSSPSSTRSGSVPDNSQPPFGFIKTSIRPKPILSRSAANTPPKIFSTSSVTHHSTDDNGNAPSKLKFTMTSTFKNQNRTPQKHVNSSPPKMVQSMLGDSIRKHLVKKESDRKDSSDASTDEGDDEPRAEVTEAVPEISARERRRREFEAARAKHESQKQTAPEGSADPVKQAKKKRMSRELEALTEWSDWIQQTLDKKSAQEREHAKQLEIKITPPRKKRRNAEKKTSDTTDSAASQLPKPILPQLASFWNSSASPITPLSSQALDRQSSQTDLSLQTPPIRQFPAPSQITIQPTPSSSRPQSFAPSDLQDFTSLPSLPPSKASTPPFISSAQHQQIVSSKGSSSTPPISLRLPTFNEPTSSEPIMSVTGMPLGAPPSAKIKKESLWPKKRQVKRKNTRRKKSDGGESDSEQQETSPEAELIGTEVIESELSKKLKTHINEQLQKPSEIRSSRNLPDVIPSAADLSRSTTPEEPETPRKKHTHKKSGKDEKRKIKNASPKKNRENPFGFDNPLQLAGEKRETAFDFADSTKDNDDYCACCGEPGIFLCCESCPRSFHFACCDPPFDESSLPEDEWFCNECTARRHPPAPNQPGLFAKLLDQCERRNPTQFRLPKHIRDRFGGVITGQYGEYMDADTKPYVPTKIGAFQQTAPELHYDKNGKPLICVKCGESGITPNKLMGDVDKPIITCGYCPSSWHLDCLNPPLSSIKQLGKKWKCPNHADGLVPRKRRLKKARITDVDLTRGFRNDGNVDIRLASGSESEDDTPVRIPTPPYLANYDTRFGVGAMPSEAQQNLWKDEFVVYRIPERGVVLDFMDKVRQMKDAERDAKIDEYYRISRENRELLQKLVLEDRDASEKQALASLVELKENDFKELVKIAVSELEPDVDSAMEDEDATISEEEMKELLQIKKLMSLKGKKKLIEFLKH